MIDGITNYMAFRLLLGIVVVFLAGVVVTLMGQWVWQHLHFSLGWN